MRSALSLSGNQLTLSILYTKHKMCIYNIKIMIYLLSEKINVNVICVDA